RNPGGDEQEHDDQERERKRRLIAGRDDENAERLEQGQDEGSEGDARHRLEAAEHDDDEGPNEEDPPEIGVERIEHRQEAAGKTGEGGSQAERQPKRLLPVDTDDLRAVRILNRGADRSAPPASVQKKLERRERAHGAEEHDEPNFGNDDRSQA